ncbi:MAG: PIN domain-containing protein [Acidobacteria bacterium]|nr:PIN domain-containing protein [Acidobacteriota bacterium]
MNFLPAYVETSALLKLLLPEPEGDALALVLGRWPDWVTSELTTVECRRALKRERANASVRARADYVLARCVLVKIDTLVLRLAEHVGPRDVRSLDAIHLATALSCGDHPEAFITYDDRLAAAARALKLNVLQPGRAGK